MLKKELSNLEIRKNLEIGAGLCAVDGLKVSSYFYRVAKEAKSYDEAKKLIECYYKTYESGGELCESRQKECDIVATRIASVLENRGFTFSPASLCAIHKELFSGVFEGSLRLYAGRFRDYNITKNEAILQTRSGEKKSVIYADYTEIDECLAYDFERERKKPYAKMDLQTQIRSFAKFVFGIWQVHPFAEGNTRTTAVFAVKYLNSKGFLLDNSLFCEHSRYFRDALVLANFADLKSGFDVDSSFLESFFARLILGEGFALKTLVNPYFKS